MIISRAAARFVVFLILLGTSLAVPGCGKSGGGDGVPPTPVLSITLISPGRGATIGTTEVTITGAAFAAGMTVTIGGTAATNVKVQSSTSALAVAEPHAAGRVDVTVAIGSQSSTMTGGFTYADPTPASMPVIAGFTAQGSRLGLPAAGYVEAGDEVTVTANVQSNDGTPASQFTYDWTAEAGTITGTGPSIKWRAPVQVPKGTDFRLTLKVTRSIEVALPIYPASIVSVSGSTTLRVHNSVTEVSDLSVKFLDDFSHSNIPASDVVQGFWNGCDGKWSELQDVQNNRNLFNIFKYTIFPPRFATINFGGVCDFRSRAGDACVAVPTEWHSLRFSNNQTETTVGTDYLALVYREKRWWLCDSDYGDYSVTNPLLPRFIR